MEQRDFIQKQIDQLGRVLGELLSSLLNLKSQGKMSEVMKVVDQSLKNELGLDVEELMSIQAENLIDILKVEKNISSQNMDRLAEILFSIADIKQATGGKPELLFKQCLTIYEHLERVESTYSFDRHLRIERIKNVQDR